MWDGKLVEQDQAQMETARSGFTEFMRDAAIWFLPGHQQIDAVKMPGAFRGPQGDVRIFDPHAQQSVDTAVSIFEGYVMPRGQIWQRWQLPDEDLMKLRHVREWVEAKNMRLFKLRNDPKSGFTGQHHQGIASLLVMGQQAMWPSIRRDRLGQPIGLGYKNDFIGQVYWRTDHQGLPSVIHYAFTWSAEKAAAAFGDEAPEKVKKAMRDGHKTTEFQFIHAIKPNPEFDPARLDEYGKPWLGCYVLRDGCEVFKRGGYRAMPRIVSRYETSPNEDYGRCPAFKLLPAVKACQQLVQDLMLASELNAMPPMGAHSDLLDETVRYAAHQITYGAIDHRGNRKLVPLIEGADMSGSFQMLERLQQLIDRGFFNDLLAIRQDLKSHVTDSQLYGREEEKGILLNPLANQETEWLSPQLDREIDLMDEMGEFEDMPGEVHEALQGGMGLLDVSYDNGLTRAQEASAAAGYFRTMEQLTPVFQVEGPGGETWQKFTEKWPLEKAMDNLGRINGIPASWEASVDERKGKADANARRAELGEILGAAPILAKSAKDLAGAVPAVAA